MSEIQTESFSDIITNIDSGIGRILFFATMGLSGIYVIMSSIKESYDKHEEQEDWHIINMFKHPLTDLNIITEFLFNDWIIRLTYDHLHPYAALMLPVYYIGHILGIYFLYKTNYKSF